MTKRVILIILAAACLLVSLPLMAAGGAIMGIFGRDGAAQTSSHPLTTPTRALVSPSEDVQGAEIFQSVQTPVFTVRATATNGKRLFLGVAPKAAIDTYLGNVTREVVTGLDYAPYRVQTQLIRGAAQPAPPGQQTFWTIRATGTAVAVRIPLGSGDVRVVLMNADASAGVAAGTRFGMQVPHLFGFALGLFVVGLALLVLGIVVFIAGVRARRKAAPAPYPGVPGDGRYAGAAGYAGSPGGYVPPGYAGQPTGYPPQPGGQPGYGVPPGQPQGYPPQAYQGQQGSAGYPGQQPYQGQPTYQGYPGQPDMPAPPAAPSPAESTRWDAPPPPEPATQEWRAPDAAPPVGPPPPLPSGPAPDGESTLFQPSATARQDPDETDDGQGPGATDERRLPPPPPA